MTNKKISELTALTAPASTDVLPIVDVSGGGTGSNNKITETTIGGNHFRTVFIPVWPARPGPTER